MKIVLDTNVLVAGLLSPFGPCGEIVRMVSSGEVTLCFDALILVEYSEVMYRSKFGFDKEKVAALLNHIEHRGHTVASSPLRHSLPDPDDEPFLKVALAEKAVCLVTGNASHFPAKLCQGRKILSPGGFLTFYKTQQKAKGK
ncbi:MAG: putative toxin-antitoxin system toxin component, PIN family [Desulfobacterales bacterium]|jgi:putative PIN family toxin of toxin-antitoxin system|nr:putative toxin-antitoxin system toxin component, PIN family [Desulfobacterales bacterium]